MVSTTVESSFITVMNGFSTAALVNESHTLPKRYTLRCFFCFTESARSCPNELTEPNAMRMARSIDFIVMLCLIRLYVIRAEPPICD